jgi:anaerobic ribonucleoside-triphosphate reductase activating protein
VQGCTLRCPGCFNPETHGSGGESVTVDALFEWLRELEVDGLTVSGGEPLQQAPALLALLRRVRRETGLSILVFTGFEWNEVLRLPEADELLGLVDVLLVGRYDERRRLALGLRGSESKVARFLTPRYTERDLLEVPVAEVVIEPDGTILLSGIDPLKV